MNGKRFLTLLAHHGIPASCFAQRLGCNLSSIKKLKAYNTVPKHYVNKLLNEFGAYLSEKDVENLKRA